MTDGEWENPNSHGSGAAVITVDKIPQVKSKASHTAAISSVAQKLRVFIEKSNSSSVEQSRGSNLSTKQYRSLGPGGLASNTIIDFQL